MVRKVSTKKIRGGVKVLLLATAFFLSVPLFAAAQSAAPSDGAQAVASQPVSGANIPAASTAPQAAGTGSVAINPNMPGQAVAGGQTVGGNVSGNSDQQWDANALAKLEQSLNQHVAISPPTVRLQDLRSLFFTPWQYALLNEAKQSFKTRPPSKDEVDNGAAPKPEGPREVSLGGISYVNRKEWTVWLNSLRVKPDAIPKEIIDLKVSRDHIDLKWYDNASNLVYPIRLHPHERFNLDQRIFLPGAGI